VKLSAGLNPGNNVRVAFILINSASWTGGYNYLLNLFSAIENCQTSQIRPILFCGEDVAESDLSPFFAAGNIEVIGSPLFNRCKKLPRLLRSLLMGVDANALRLFQQHKIDVVFENATFYGRRFSLPVIAWLPDFQHRHLRDQFGFGAYWRREWGFRTQVAFGRIIMLSSEDARKDCEHFYPGATGNTAVVRFAASIPAELIEDFPEAVIPEYRLPPKFFYLPNQFWRHKNHMVVIEALGLLKQQGYEVVVAVTGNPLDPRHPEYIGQLNARVEMLGLRDNFRILGLVPRRHVISLLRACTALINPSFFEGWSSTVEEARALGVPMLLSDIAVHREQMQDAATYFDADDAKCLAAKLREITLNSPPLTLHREPDAQNDENVCRFARDFATVVDKAIARYRLTRPAGAD
jgi:glycosyltransferase involved in cell wall biosynthesis